MLRKLVTSLNPFARKPAPPAPSDEPPITLSHAHRFSCACGSCVAHTDRLTLERLKRQGA